MKPYRDIDGDSGVEAYEYGADFIIIRFSKGRYTEYTYTYSSAGVNNIEKMKRLADAGDGLNEFISECKPDYASKR